MERKPVYLLGKDRRVSRFFEKFENSFDVLMAIIESSFDGIYITDGKANTIYINNSYSVISGLSENEVLGKNMEELERSGAISRSGTLIALKKRKTVTLEQEFKSGKKVIITSTPVFDEEGTIAMVVTNVRDQSELYRLREQLEESSEIAQKYYSEIELMRKQVQQRANIITIDREMQDILNVVERVAQLDTPVLFLGETGVGKERIATYLYSKSKRDKENFIKVTCGAIPENLIESELFGYEPGAFPGANATGKIGYFGVADKGTIFLDEVCDLSLNVQAKLLRVMQEHEIIRVGSDKPVPIDVRIIASTNHDLEKMVEMGKLRKELYYQLNVFPIEVPPLRKRKDDIPILAQHMLMDFNRKYDKKKIFNQEALKALMQYHWPGNVRELKNIVERAFIMSGEETITDSDLSLHPHHSNEIINFKENKSLNLKDIMESMELEYLNRAYDVFGNVRDAARSLNMDPATFIRKRKKYSEKFS
jgi:PAS domain S-box-containing protein